MVMTRRLDEYDFIVIVLILYACYIGEVLVYILYFVKRDEVCLRHIGFSCNCGCMFVCTCGGY